MKPILKYVASSGNEYDLKTNGIITKEANYHVWEWGIDGTDLQYGVRIADFLREAAVYTTQIIFDGLPKERKEIVERLHEDFEFDVREKKPGRIIWGDYYIDCFITASSTQPGNFNWWTENDITIYCPLPFWTKEDTRHFFGRSSAGGDEFLDYEHDYDYDYYIGDPGVATWNTNFPFESDFRLTVFGPVSNPRILINGYPYQFNDTLEAGEYATIDSRDNTLIKVTTAGRHESIFDTRNKAQSIFQKVPGGELFLNWSGLFGFDLTLYEERSEPRWNT